MHLPPPRPNASRLRRRFRSNRCLLPLSASFYREQQLHRIENHDSNLPGVVLKRDAEQ